MNNKEQLISHLQVSLDQIASKKTKEWWEKYLRNVILFRGVGIPENREGLAQWRLDYNIATWDKQEQLSIALKLFESPIAEDKLAGILFLQEYLYDQFDWEELLPKYAQLYVKELIFDWNTCDWFCVRVLGPTIAKNGLPCAEAITSWNREDNLWQARSSVVAFVPVSGERQYYPLIYRSCNWLIQREERFACRAHVTDRNHEQWVTRGYDNRGRPVCPFGYAFSSFGFDRQCARQKWACDKACLKALPPRVALPQVSYPSAECPYQAEEHRHGQVINVAETFADGSLRLARDIPMGSSTWKTLYHRARNAVESRNATFEAWSFKRLSVFGMLRAKTAIFLADVGQDMHLSCDTLTTLARLVREATQADLTA